MRWIEERDNVCFVQGSWSLSGSIEQDSLYKRRTYLVCRNPLVFHTSAVTFSTSHFRVLLLFLMLRYSTKCPFCVHASNWGVLSLRFWQQCSLTLRFRTLKWIQLNCKTPAVTLLQISHNSLQISQAVKLHGCPVPLLCCSEQASYQLSFSLLMFTKLVSKCGKRKWRVQGKKVQMRFNYQTLWSTTTTHLRSTLLCWGHSFRLILLKNFKNHHELNSQAISLNHSEKMLHWSGWWNNLMTYSTNCVYAKHYTKSVH